MNPWDKHIGKRRERTVCLSKSDMVSLAALLDYPLGSNALEPSLPWPTDALPPFAHWLKANPPARQSELGTDGHPRMGGFIPLVGLSRRMWAGSRVTLLRDYQLGGALLHRETLKSIERKSGRSGELVFVTVLHEFIGDNTPVLQEEQNLVYREATQNALPRPELIAEEEVLAGYDFDWHRTVHPDATLLFRYSAASCNGHRIHYDRDYATGVEYYPGLVVHGPLTATLLIDLFQRNNPGQRVKSFDFRGLRPLYDSAPFYIMGKRSAQGGRLWAVDSAGELAMEMNLCAS